MTSRDRRAIALGLALTGAAWLGLKGLPRLKAAANRVSERRAAAALALARARETLALEPLARESLGVRAARLVAWAPRLFSGTTPNEAAADLSSFATGTASLRRVRIIRQDARPDSSASVFTRLALRVEAEGDIEGITGWIAGLEESPRLIEVQALAITAPEPAAPTAQPERLHVELVLVGWGAIRHSQRS